MSLKNLQTREKVLGFHGIPSTGTAGYVLTRMKGFTEFGHSKNPEEYERKYVDEANKRTDIVGYSPAWDYSFDKHLNDPVQADIIKITNHEYTGDQAVRTLLIVDTSDGSAVLRDYTVVPDTEGDDENVYTYSGTYKANGEAVFGTATSTDNWATVTFKPEGTD